MQGCGALTIEISQMFDVQWAYRMASRMKKKSSVFAKIHSIVHFAVSGLRICMLVSFFGIAIWSILSFTTRRALSDHPAKYSVFGALKGVSYVDAAVAVDPTLLSPDATKLLMLGTDRLVSPISSILGVSTSNMSPLSQWKMIRETDTRKFEGWKKKIAQYPSFADVYFKAAYFAIRLGKYKEARTLISEGLTVSPTSDVASRLTAHIPRE